MKASAPHVTLSRSHHEPGGPLMWAVLLDGQPVMASTSDETAARAQFAATTRNLNGRCVREYWDGDTGTLTPTEQP